MSTHHAVQRLRALVDAAAGAGEDVVVVRRDELAAVVADMPCRDCVFLADYRKAWQTINGLRETINELQAAGMSGALPSAGPSSGAPGANETAPSAGVPPAPLPAACCDHCYSATKQARTA